MFAYRGLYEINMTIIHGTAIRSPGIKIILMEIYVSDYDTMIKTPIYHNIQDLRHGIKNVWMITPVYSISDKNPLR